MTHGDMKEVARRIRGLKKDVERLKGQRENEGEVNLLRSVIDQADATDSVSVTTRTGATFDYDESSFDGSDTWG